jgi:hypothetical protein
MTMMDWNTGHTRHLPQRSQDKLRVLRHLPIGTQLTRPATQTDNQLVDELLQLDETIPASNWLVEQRPRPTALIALRWLLVSVQTALRSAHAARLAGRDPVPEIGHWIGPLLVSETASRLITAPIPAVDELAEVLRILHAFQEAYSHGPSSPPSPPSPAEPLVCRRIASELLSMRTDQDPVAWLLRKYPTWAGEYVLKWLMRSCNPPKALEVRSVAQLDSEPTEVVREGVTVRVETVELLTTGLVISVRIARTGRNAGELTQPSEVGYWFEGFDSVTDSTGAEFLLMEAREDPRDARTPQRLVLQYYPSVPRDGRFLTLACTPLALRIAEAVPTQWSANAEVRESVVALGNAEFRVGL